jgi:hypothetical protein
MTAPLSDKHVHHILALSGGKDSSALAVFIVRRKMLFKSLLFGGRGVKRDMWEQANGAKLGDVRTVP